MSTSTATKTKKKGMSFLAMLLAFVLIPLLICTVVLSAVTITINSKAMKESTSNSLVTTVTETGIAFDYATETDKKILQTYADAPVIREYLADQENVELAAKAEKYTLDFFGKLEGWEGLYLANWGTKVLTHPTQAVIGKVLREGDGLKELQNAMAGADGVLDGGIMESPASGKIVLSLYYAIYDGDTPVGYVGGAVFVNELAAKFSDVSSLGLSSAYTYFVSHDGVMLHHPDETKIGSPAENDAVKGIVSKLQAGETLKPGFAEYNYKGAQKYAGYYVGNDYVAMLTADESEILKASQSTAVTSIAISAGMMIVFIILGIVFSRKISKPFGQISKATTELAKGNVGSDVEIQSNIRETNEIADATKVLQSALRDSIVEVKNSAKSLDATIYEVTEQTNDNAERIGQINVAIDEVAQTSQSVAENAQKMSEQADNLGLAIDTITDNIKALKISADTIAVNNDAASEQVQTVMDSSKESVKAISDITAKIMETNEAIKGISDCVVVIEEISEQTNLLSLNASIEAARAGEAGKGFAVVAEEIRKLADTSAESSKKIQEIIYSVSLISKDTVEYAERVTAMTAEEQEYILDTQAKFTELSVAVNNSLAQISNIKELADSLSDIKRKLVDATCDLGAISEELGASAQEVSASCNLVAVSCDETKDRTENMQSLDSQMIEAIDFFKI